VVVGGSELPVLLVSGALLVYSQLLVSAREAPNLAVQPDQAEQSTRSARPASARLTACGWYRVVRSASGPSIKIRLSR
jgi:hypothetical protein